MRHLLWCFIALAVLAVIGVASSADCTIGERIETRGGTAAVTGPGRCPELLIGTAQLQVILCDANYGSSNIDTISANELDVTNAGADLTTRECPNVGFSMNRPACWCSAQADWLHSLYMT